MNSKNLSLVVLALLAASSSTSLLVGGGDEPGKDTDQQTQLSLETTKAVAAGLVTQGEDANTPPCKCCKKEKNKEGDPQATAPQSKRQPLPTSNPLLNQ